MPAQASVPTFMLGRLYISGETSGWVENYPMNIQSDLTLARTNLATLATARARILAKGHKILRATVSNKEVRRDAVIASGYVYEPVIIGSEMDAPEETNTSGVGLLFRFDTGDGRFSNRLIKGVRDSWITRNRFTLGTPTAYPTGGPYLSYSAPAAALALLGDYLAKFRDLCCLFKQTGTGPNSYTPFSYESYVFRRVSKHDEGKRIGIGRGRQSSMS